MKINDNGSRYQYLKKYEHKLHQPYDYEIEGLNNRILSNKIYNTKNIMLQYILKVYENNIIFLLKYVDILQNIFNFRWRNR